MYINSGGKPVYDYVFQADRHNIRSWRRGYDYRNKGYYGYSSPYYFGNSYSYPVHSYYHHPVRTYPIYGGHHYGGYHGYHGGIHVHGAFSVGGLRVHVNF